MKRKLMNKYGITENGAKNLIKASAASFWQNVTYMFPLMLILLFLMKISETRTLSFGIFFVGMVAIFLLMYYVINKQYLKSYSATYKESEELRYELVGIMKKLPLSYFSKHNLTDISQTIMADIANIEQAISHAICTAYGWCGFFVLVSVMLIAGSPLLGICIVIPVFAAVLILFKSKNIQHKMNSQYYSRLRENSQEFQDAFEMQQEIKSYNLQRNVRKNVTDKLKDTEKIHIKSEFSTNIPSSLLSTLSQFSMALVIILGLRMYLAGELNLIFCHLIIFAGKILRNKKAMKNRVSIMNMNKDKKNLPLLFSVTSASNFFLNSISLSNRSCSFKNILFFAFLFDCEK